MSVCLTQRLIRHHNFTKQRCIFLKQPFSRTKQPFILVKQSNIYAIRTMAQKKASRH
ncbi:MAG: hypothetical protein LBL74_03855 [Bacteroidales bacterium]|nr:hypothetical protein [Bacteroidales bacterium]